MIFGYQPGREPITDYYGKDQIVKNVEKEAADTTLWERIRYWEELGKRWWTLVRCKHQISSEYNKVKVTDYEERG